jgi:hypothetical protein
LSIVYYGLIVHVFAGEHIAGDATKIDESHIYALVIDYAKGWITWTTFTSLVGQNNAYICVSISL